LPNPTFSEPDIRALLTAQTLTRIAPSITPMIRDAIVADAPAVFARHRIDTICRIAHALAQFKRETGGLRRLDENLAYASAARLMAVWPRRFPTVASAAPYVRNARKLANFVYARRNGNGPAASGDGYAYRGSGLIQLTGRGNFRTVGELIGMGRTLEDDPEIARRPASALLIGAGYWTAREINEAADGDAGADVDRVTRRINPFEGGEGMGERRANFAAILKILRSAAAVSAPEQPSAAGSSAARPRAVASPAPAALSRRVPVRRAPLTAARTGVAPPRRGARPPRRGAAD
jgi:putative chitinase